MNRKTKRMRIQTKKISLNESLQKSIVYWNNKYPFDYIWRKKYGVAFGSKKHRQTSFLDMVFDIKEQILFDNIAREAEVMRNSKISKPDTILTDEEFDNIDISQFNN